jgi:hypothetical protein
MVVLIQAGSDLKAVEASAKSVDVPEPELFSELCPLQGCAW